VIYRFPHGNLNISRQADVAAISTQNTVKCRRRAILLLLPTLQSLEPNSARLCLSVEKFLLEESDFSPQGKEFILAYSGGADSKALFFILLALRPRLRFTLALAHLDHAFRASSAEELEAARLLAEQYALPFYGKRLDAPAPVNLKPVRKMGREEAGRLARQQFFAEIRANPPVPQASGPLQGAERWIVTGHQLNDLAEDILMRLLRGGGWPALGGMRAVDAENRLLRPLLLTPRQKLEDFLLNLKQDWLRDPMNDDQAFLRNRVRAKILPLFLQENPAFLETCADLWRMARLDQILFEQDQRLVLPADGKLMPDATLRAMPKALRLRAYKRLLEQSGPGQPLLRNLLALDKAWEKLRYGATTQFPGRKTVRVSPQGLLFGKPFPH
jgi:tRNA(Ile)-lysidine synthase